MQSKNVKRFEAVQRNLRYLETATGLKPENIRNSLRNIQNTIDKLEGWDTDITPLQERHDALRAILDRPVSGVERRVREKSKPRQERQTRQDKNKQRKSK